MRVRDVMTTDVATVAPDTDLRDVAALLVQLRISGVPVVDGGKVVGVVSEGDILFKERAADGLHRGVLGWLMDEGDLMLKVDARTAAQAMTSPAVTIRPDRGVAAAAALMLDEGVSRLAVVDHGALVGIVTRHDLVRAFARSDEEILQEIQADAIVRGYWLQPATYDIRVEQGRRQPEWQGRRQKARRTHRSLRRSSPGRRRNRLEASVGGRAMSATDATPLLVAEQVRKVYRSGADSVVALEGLDLVVPQGRVPRRHGAVGLGEDDTAQLSLGSRRDRWGPGARRRSQHSRDLRSELARGTAPKRWDSSFRPST